MDGLRNKTKLDGFSGNSLLQVKVFCKNHFIRLKNHNSLLYRDYGHLNTYFFLHVFVFLLWFSKNNNNNSNIRRCRRLKWSLRTKMQVLMRLFSFQDNALELTQHNWNRKYHPIHSNFFIFSVQKCLRSFQGSSEEKRSRLWTPEWK